MDAHVQSLMLVSGQESKSRSASSSMFPLTVPLCILILVQDSLVISMFPSTCLPVGDEKRRDDPDPHGNRERFQRMNVKGLEVELHLCGKDRC